MRHAGLGAVDLGGVGVAVGGIVAAPGDVGLGLSLGGGAARVVLGQVVGADLVVGLGVSPSAVSSSGTRCVEGTGSVLSDIASSSDPSRRTLRRAERAVQQRVAGQQRDEHEDRDDVPGSPVSSAVAANATRKSTTTPVIHRAMEQRYPPRRIGRLPARRPRPPAAGSGVAARRPAHAAALLLGGLPAGVVLGQVVGADLVVGLGRVAEGVSSSGVSGPRGSRRVVVAWGGSCRCSLMTRRYPSRALRNNLSQLH